MLVKSQYWVQSCLTSSVMSGWWSRVYLQQAWWRHKTKRSDWCIRCAILWVLNRLEKLADRNTMKFNREPRGWTWTSWSALVKVLPIGWGRWLSFLFSWSAGSSSGVLNTRNMYRLQSVQQRSTQLIKGLEHLFNEHRLTAETLQPGESSGRISEMNTNIWREGAKSQALSTSVQ